MRHAHYDGIGEEDGLREGGGRGKGQHDPLGEKRGTSLFPWVQGKPHLQQQIKDFNFHKASLYIILKLLLLVQNLSREEGEGYRVPVRS